MKGVGFLADQTGTTGSIPKAVALERDELLAPHPSFALTGHLIFHCQARVVADARQQHLDALLELLDNSVPVPAGALVSTDGASPPPPAPASEGSCTEEWPSKLGFMLGGESLRQMGQRFLDKSDAAISVSFEGSVQRLRRHVLRCLAPFLARIVPAMRHADTVARKAQHRAVPSAWELPAPCHYWCPAGAGPCACGDSDAPAPQPSQRKKRTLRPRFRRKRAGNQQLPLQATVRFPAVHVPSFIPKTLLAWSTETGPSPDDAVDRSRKLLASTLAAERRAGPERLPPPPPPPQQNLSLVQFRRHMDQLLGPLWTGPAPAPRQATIPGRPLVLPRPRPRPVQGRSRPPDFEQLGAAVRGGGGGLGHSIDALLFPASRALLSRRRGALGIHAARLRRLAEVPSTSSCLPWPFPSCPAPCVVAADTLPDTSQGLLDDQSPSQQDFPPCSQDTLVSPEPPRPARPLSPSSLPNSQDDVWQSSY